ncbi:L,D-transpeptidase family protein [Hyalangium versicolor]|uniref:L,D-transpeptidase family protein n=1 Tax=Hyalangium versicolor TaxID=2861190 RepID=UPI001CCB84A6|nr:L,D-transpeptidase family protein [Hyalangium versicolor]
MRTALTCLLLTYALTTHAEDRVAAARQNRTHALSELFASAGLQYPPGELYLRAFKQERELEVWAGARGQPLVKVKTYPFCAASGELGPKRQQGDLQVPEGFYTIDLFNPWSDFHLSMRVSYPNESDRILGGRPLGGAIMVHGDCVSIGCIAIQDDPIEELYVLTLDSRAKMGREVPIHIFPRRLDAEGMAALEKLPYATPSLVAFWRGLEPGWRLFEESHRPPRVSVDAKTGAYRVRPEPPPRAATPQPRGARATPSSQDS